MSEKMSQLKTSTKIILHDLSLRDAEMLNFVISEKIDLTIYNFKFDLDDAILDCLANHDYDLSNLDANDLVESLDRSIITQIQNDFIK